MARSLERQLKQALDMVYIDAVMIREGRALGPLPDRLAFMASNVAEAQAIQSRIAKRDARLERQRLAEDCPYCAPDEPCALHLNDERS